MPETFEQGWSAAPFKEQFPELSDTAAGLLDKVNHAITLLAIHEIITESEKDKARQKRFPKLVASALERARKGSKC
jgi:hypothetical protein